MPMKPAERYEWIKEYLQQTPGGGRGTVDVCDRDFVVAYHEATGVAVQWLAYGAPRCPQLGRDLAKMHKDYILKRSRAGIEGMSGMGFPKWVWIYALHPVWVPSP
jgi:hypothetical protein